MERVGKVSRNAAALVVAKVVTSSLVFLLAILVNRELGPERAGIYSYAFTLYTILMVIPDFGIGNISVRDVSQDHSKISYYFTNIITLRFLLALGAFTLLMGINFLSYFFQRSGSLATEKFWVVFAIAFSLLVEQPFSNSLAENFIALERLTVVALVYMIMGVMRVTLSIYVLARKMEPVLVLLVVIYIFTYIYSIGHFSLVFRRYLRRRDLPGLDPGERVLAEVIAQGHDLMVEPGLRSLETDSSYVWLKDGGWKQKGGGNREEVPAPSSRFDRRLWRYLLRSAWPLAVVAAGITIYAGLDIPILSWIRGNEEVGLYAAGGMFAKAFVFFTIAINMSILPAISMVGGKYPERLGEIWERMIRYVLILVIPLVVMAPVLARPVLLLQKHQFIDAWHVVWLTMAAMIFTFMTAISFPFFIAIDRQKQITRVVLTGLGIKAAISFLLIPALGYTGAAINVLVSEMLIFFLLYLALSRELSRRIPLSRLLCTPFLSLGVLYGMAFLLHRLLITGRGYSQGVLGSLGYAGVIAALLLVAYVVFAWVSGMVNKRDLGRLNELLRVEGTG
jgi:O-antigen/teichoic acid export membrane protein